MADPRFFRRQGPFALARLAEVAGARLIPGADPARLIADIAPLDTAGPDEVSFLDNRRYLAAFAASGAGACLVEAEHCARAPAHLTPLMSERPRRAFARIARLFYPEPAADAFRHAGAAVGAGCRIGANCRIEAGAVLGAGVELGEGCRVEANAVLGDGVRIGRGTIVGAGAALSHCLIGDRVVIYPGARIGQPGFGFEQDAAGPVKMPQLGRVILGDDVEVGANTTIDRGSGPDTVIGAGTMIDNLVQIGHNVRIGKGCIIVAQVGIAGSTRIGDHVVLAGQVGIAGHLEIGDRAQIAAKSGVHRNVPADARMGGIPAVPVERWRRQVASVARLGLRRPGAGKAATAATDREPPA